MQFSFQLFFGLGNTALYDLFGVWGESGISSAVSWVKTEQGLAVPGLARI